MLKSFIKLSSRARIRAPFACALSLSLLVSGGCFSGDEGGQFYGRVNVPRPPEFRWSDGGLPRVFDPARAATPPDTDAVRALYDGLTDYDPQTLAPVSADAYRWEASKDNRVWTFFLRGDARWSNGDAVTAQDYLRSWQRTLKLGDDAPHAELLSNLLEPAQSKVELSQPSHAPETQLTSAEQNATRAASVALRLAVEAVDAHTLRVRLRRPDPNLPSLLAHTIFRPVHASTRESEASETNAHEPERLTAPPLTPVTNGAFQLAEATNDSVVLERDARYRDASNVALERVSFVNERDTESALRAYRDGKIDALTNVNVEPAALKLLASYQDFERVTFGALTFYDFNTTRPPFDDVRVREAFALALDRKRLSEDTLGGATVPADKFLLGQDAEDSAQLATHDDKQATGEDVGDATNGNDETNRDEQVNVQDKIEKTNSRPLSYDPTRARLLLAQAGYPGGDGFPHIRLLVNRNEQHRQVAEAVAEMWRSVLGVETEIESKSWDEYETMLRAGEYDVAKRSMIMQTPDEEQSLAAMFPSDRFVFGVADTQTPTVADKNSPTPTAGPSSLSRPVAKSANAPELLSEADALREVPAIPIYFASAFALVKPYVRNFDSNLLGVYSLKRVRLDANWQPPGGKPEQGIAR